VEDGRVAYFNGNMPVFIHDKDDIATFRTPDVLDFTIIPHCKLA